MPPKIDFEDFGIGKLKEELAKMRSTRITVGFQGESGARAHPDADGATVADVARWQEYGTESDAGVEIVPARPFMETAFQRAEQFKAHLRKAISDVIDQRADVPTALRTLGDAAVAAVHAAIDDSRSWAKPLAASTIRAKGHDHPLVDSRTMRDAVSWAAREGIGGGGIVQSGGGS